MCAGYGASKTGVIMLTKVAACELAPYHIRCNAVAPGESQLGTFAGLHFAQGRHSGLSLQIRLCFSFNFVCLRATCCPPPTHLFQSAGYIATPMLAEAILGDLNKPQEGVCLGSCCCRRGHGAGSVGQYRSVGCGAVIGQACSPCASPCALTHM